MVDTEHQEQVFLDLARGRRYLRDIAEDFRPQNGILLVACGDGDRFPELFTHLKKFTPRIHVVAQNGAPWRLTPNFPGNEKHLRHESLLEDILEGVRLKGVHDVVYASHWPCGKAKDCEIPLKKALCYALQSHAILWELLRPRGVTLWPMLHVDRQTQPMRTYTIDDAITSILPPF